MDHNKESQMAKVTTFLYMGPSKIASKTISHTSQLKDRFNSRLKKKPVVDSQKDETQKFISFFSQAPTQIVTKSSLQLSLFKKKLMQKVTYVYPIESVVLLQQFFGVASDKVVQQNSQKYTNFIQQLRQKQQKAPSAVKNSSVVILSEFMAGATNRVSQSNLDKSTRFMQSLRLKQKVRPIKTNLKQFILVAPNQLIRFSVTKYQNLIIILQERGQQINLTKSKQLCIADSSSKIQDDSQAIEDAQEQLQENLLVQQIETNDQESFIVLEDQNPALMDQTYVQDLTIQGPREYKEFQVLQVFANEIHQKVSQSNMTKFQQFSSNLSSKSKIVIAKKREFSHLEMQFIESNRNKDISEIAYQNMDDQSRLKSPFQEQSICEEIQIINLLQQPVEKKKVKPTEFRNKLNVELEHSRYLNEKEHLKLILQKELEVISHEIREMRGQQQYSNKPHRKLFVQPKRDIEDDQDVQGQALDLVKRMNQQRKDRRLRQKQQYAKLEHYMRDEIDKLRIEQDNVNNQMDNNRKVKIQKRMDDYNKRQMQFSQMQQANQEFIRDLMNQGPQEGQLAHQFDEKISQIQGQQVQRKLKLKQGAIVYLPSIHNKQERNIFQHQREQINQHSKSHIKGALPQVRPNYSISERLMQAELERAMIQQYKESKQTILLHSLEVQDC